MPALQALTDGYFVYAVEDASGGMSPVGHHAALGEWNKRAGVGDRPASAAGVPARLGTQ